MTDYTHCLTSTYNITISRMIQFVPILLDGDVQLFEICKLNQVFEYRISCVNWKGEKRTGSYLLAIDVLDIHQIADSKHVKQQARMKRDCFLYHLTQLQRMTAHLLIHDSN